MPLLSLTDFVDIVSKSGTPKITKIRQIKVRPDYNPALDYYKLLRNRLIETHEKNLGKSYLKNLLQYITDQRKLHNYEPLIEEYCRWWGRTKYDWFNPPSGKWTHGSVQVTINPELGLIKDGKKLLIKLYFKSDKLSKNKVSVILYLMKNVLVQENSSDMNVGIHDIRHGKMYTSPIKEEGLDAMLKGEAAYIETV
ncbi:hypothetical protein J2S00_001552 [Caldalkalibacillus uzonensis]|uniref:Uncharacterized protein n=1 Tax=Caldalkalibacillus uzonensis TaxID=353224 RepID=A0ABU0CQS3_9BACI|nr:hypothetical protein [Caldalkalibacillus uzonensis]MDQ0338766.1 hypothetical protein [Caldalkalibacillus uzonensis]